MAVRAVAALLHAVMPSDLFVSWVEDMLVLIRSKFSGKVIGNGCASSGSLVRCWPVR